VHQLWVRVEQTLQSDGVACADRHQRCCHPITILASALPARRFLSQPLNQPTPSREPVLARDDQPSIGDRRALDQHSVIDRDKTPNVRSHAAPSSLIPADEPA
jgi:hypothetical protein